mgnify:CR=1 FL=1
METIIPLLIFAAIAVFVYLKRNQVKITIWYLRRRWHLYEVEEEPTRCLTISDMSLDEIKEIFKYIAQRTGSRYEFDHIAQYIDRNKYGRQLLSCRIVEGGHQYHFRVMPSSGKGMVITGHYETTPDGHPVKHYFGINADLQKACKIFKKFYDEYRSQQYQI